MDNLCHTLIGAALAECGLKRRTGLGMATLVIGANLPDVDVLAIPFGHGIDFRRGWTHGVLALVLLPVALTAMMMAYDRWVRRRGGRAPDEAAAAAPVVPGQVLLLAAIAVLSHTFFDWLNTYGVRWLMPFDRRWFYGDALFIVDPWLWLMLGAAVWLARRMGRRDRRRGERAARVATGVAAAYVGGMLVLAVAGRQAVLRSIRRPTLDRADALVVSPVPLDPFRRRVTVRENDVYRFGRLTWLPTPTVGPDDTPPVPVNADLPAAFAAARAAPAQRMLRWARMPYFLVEPQGDGSALVHIDDARYAAGPRSSSFARVTVRVR